MRQKQGKPKYTIILQKGSPGEVKIYARTKTEMERMIRAAHSNGINTTIEEGKP